MEPRPASCPAHPTPRPLARPQLREELNCVAVGRTGCYVPANSDTAAIFGRRDVTAKISKVGGAAWQGLAAAAAGQGCRSEFTHAQGQQQQLLLLLCAVLCCGSSMCSTPALTALRCLRATACRARLAPPACALALPSLPLRLPYRAQGLPARRRDVSMSLTHAASQAAALA